MKAFGIWLAIVAVVFGVYALITVSLRETTQVYVFVDSSFQMESVWPDVRRELDQLDDRDQTEFALGYGQSRGSQLAHSWQSTLSLPADVVPFAPCSFAGADQFTEAAEADERILITVAGNTCDTAALADWEIVELP